MSTGTKVGTTVLVLAHGCELVDEGENKVPPQRTVVRADVPWLGAAARGVCVGGVAPRFAAEVGLVVSPAITVTIPPALSEVALAENGALVLAEVRRAVTQGRGGHLRRLCAWFPFPTLHMREVHEYLDALPRGRAEQIAGLIRGEGRPEQARELLGLVVTMDILIQERGLSAAKAAEKLDEVRGVSAGAAALANLHAELGKLVRCLRGYWIPPREAPCRRWGEKPDDEFAVHVLKK